MMICILYILLLLFPAEPAKRVKWQSVQSYDKGKWKEFERIEYHYGSSGSLDSLTVYEGDKVSSATRYLAPARPLALSDIKELAATSSSYTRYEYSTADGKLDLWVQQTPHNLIARDFSRTRSGKHYLYRYDSVSYDTEGRLKYRIGIINDSNGVVKETFADSIVTELASGTVTYYSLYRSDERSSNRIRYKYIIAPRTSQPREILIYSGDRLDSLRLVAKLADIEWVEDVQDNLPSRWSTFPEDAAEFFKRGRVVIAQATLSGWHHEKHTWINTMVLTQQYNQQGKPVLVIGPDEYTEKSYFEDGSLKSTYELDRDRIDWLQTKIERQVQSDGTLVETNYWQGLTYGNAELTPTSRVVYHY